jgi:alcohol dehydrogenase (cytochrome c)
MSADAQCSEPNNSTKQGETTMRAWTCAAALTIGLLPAAAAAYDPVTQDRLENPEPENWLLLRGNYQGWMYSPLDQINTNNVKNLTPVSTPATRRRRS